MLKSRLTLRDTFLIAGSIHCLIFIFFSIATVKEFYPQEKYLKVSLASPEIKYARPARPASFPAIQRVNYQTNRQIPHNFFYRVRKASLEVAIAPSRGKTKTLKMTCHPADFSPPHFNSFLPQKEFLNNKNIWTFLRIASPEYKCWRERIAIEKKVKLKVHLSPDGRVRGIDLSSSSGNPLLDRLIKEEISRWQFAEPLYQHD